MEASDKKPSVADAASQEPSSGKAPRSWVPRACDRCRKRKARCDQQVPCRNCAEAGVTCTHDAPVLKRGPRPKPRNRDVESRLRNLESLLASISNGGSGSSGAALSLSRRELDQIRVAANITRGSDTSPSSDADSHAGPSRVQPPPKGPGDSPLQSLDALASHAAGSPVVSTGGGPGPVTSGDYVPSIVFDPCGVPTSSQALPSMSGYGMYEAQPYAQAPKNTPAPADLLYRDNEGQTKWLGPSSGMPLLERLKINGSGAGWNQPMGANGEGPAADEWTSLSNAIGINVENKEGIDQIAGRGGPASALSPSSTRDEFLWGRITTILPPDLIDALVRCYFTISHLLWPIIHAPTFMNSYLDPEHRKNPSFIALVLSICSLSSRYTPDARLRQTTSTGQILAFDIINLAKDVTQQAAAERSDLAIVQALFNLSVVQEGIARTNQVWSMLSQAVSIAMDMGLHRRKDEYGFTAVELEEQKRTLWALYCQAVAASCTYGRPSLLRLDDIQLDEPAAVDDVYISVEKGIGTQPPDRPSVMAGFVAGVRLHMILERTVRRVNRVVRDVDESNLTFVDLVTSGQSRKFRVSDELELLSHVTDGLVGDWSFSPSTVSDSDSVRFFQRTRVFTLQQFIRLLSARHAFTEFLGAAAASAGAAEEQALLQQTTQSALGIIGTYSIIDGQGRLDFFGAHAISQLTQAGAGLIGVILHVRSMSIQGGESVLSVALQGLCASILVLRKLGTRRPAGNRAAELLLEFSRACRITIPGLPENEAGAPPGTVEVPMLRALPRRTLSTSGHPQADLSQDQFDAWLGLALQSGGDAWMGMPEGYTPDQAAWTPQQQ
ncbi:hypothetical protein Q8F55_004897 [Vanrija albida]|uniref:Zn(2)-C6 fungal-type domain-containing protein n=1 Tax=Vanrija albida TaxID=181172 RepID=A0ABR3Q038_9TREE